MKVLIIGLGSIANKHIIALKKLNNKTEIYALRRSKESSSIDGITNIFDIQDIQKVNPDFIIISNPTFAHFETIQNLTHYKTPLFIEKPLFSTVGKKENELINEIASADIPNYVACNLRFHKGVQELKKLILNQKIEEVNVYCGSYLPNWRPNVNFRTVYSANEKMGGGVHIDLIHELDYIYWYFGEPLRISKTFKSNSTLNIPAVDYANYLFEYKDFCANIVLNYYRKDAKRTCEIITDKGTYLLNLLTNEITLNNKIIYKEEQKPIDMYIYQMKFFIENILNSETKFNSVKEAYKVLNLCY